MTNSSVFESVLSNILRIHMTLSPHLVFLNSVSFHFCPMYFDIPSKFIVEVSTGSGDLLIFAWCWHFL